jgi:outer membrane immunogenic protein
MRYGIAAVAASAAFGLALAQGASAADMPVKAPAAIVAQNWTGLYVGGNIGYGWGQSSSTELFTDSNTPTNLGDCCTAGFSRGTIGSLNPSGGFIGAQIGYNRQVAPNWVLGVEADIHYSAIKGSTAGRFTNPLGTFPTDGTAEQKLQWFGTVRGRAGFVTAPGFLLYVTGGLAFGQIKYSMLASEVPPGDLYISNMNADTTRAGFTVGGGVERMINNRLSWKAEYQYIDLGSVDATAPVLFKATGLPTGETANSSVQNRFHTVRLGLNYKVGGP